MVSDSHAQLLSCHADLLFLAGMCWDSSDKQLAFQAEDSGLQKLAVKLVNIEDGSLRYLSEIKSDCTLLEWKGRHILSRERARGHLLHVQIHREDGSVVLRDQQNAAMSPDGSVPVVCRTRANEAQILVAGNITDTSLAPICLDLFYLGAQASSWRWRLHGDYHAGTVCWAGNCKWVSCQRLLSDVS